MVTLIIGSLVLSVLHALVPNHWLPVLAISRKEKWSIGQTTSVTFISGLSHALSTVLIGVAIGVVGVTLAEHFANFTHFVAPLILILLGLFVSISITGINIFIFILNLNLFRGDKWL